MARLTAGHGRIPEWASEYAALITQHEKPNYAPAPWCAGFLDAIKSIEFLHGAAKRVGITYREVCRYRNRHPWFDEAVKDAVDEARETAEMVLRSEALKGVPAPLIFYLKNTFPEKYKDRHESTVTFEGQMPELVISVESEEEYLNRIKRIAGGASTKALLPSTEGTGEPSN